VLAHSDSSTPLYVLSEEDLDLLSLAGEQELNKSPTTDIGGKLESSVPLEDVVLPSIEKDGPEDALVKEQLSITHPRIEVPIRAPRRPSKLETINLEHNTPGKPQPIPDRKRKSAFTNLNVDSDSEDIDLVPTGDPPESTAKTRNMSPPHACCDSNHKVDVPCTPHIKREPSTPRPGSLLNIPFRTPKSAPQRGAVGSSGSKDTPKLTKSQFIRQVRASWAKPGRKGTPQTVRHRKSLQLPKTKMLDDDSEDELAR
jgi:hypothetical protein